MANEQHGFRKGKSTKRALISFVERVIDSLDSGGKAQSIFLDLSKAFDCVIHDKLVNKLSEVGIKGIGNKWFESYLNGRKQYVEIFNTTTPEISSYISDQLEVIAGIPKGSTLGPVLFFIYINNLPSIVDNGKVILYADDTSLTRCGKDRLTLG